MGRFFRGQVNPKPEARTLQAVFLRGFLVFGHLAPLKLMGLGF